MSEMSKEQYKQILRNQRANGYNDASLIVYTHGVAAYALKLKLLNDGKVDKRLFHVRALECLTNAHNVIDALHEVLGEQTIEDDPAYQHHADHIQPVQNCPYCP